MLSSHPFEKYRDEIRYDLEEATRLVVLNSGRFESLFDQRTQRQGR